jgi:LAS superfamily LD-carboxypeptidase LdcB
VSKRSYGRLLRRWGTASERLSRMKRAASREGIKLSAMSGYKAAANDLIKANMALDAADGMGETRIRPTWWGGKEWSRRTL